MAYCPDWLPQQVPSRTGGGEILLTIPRYRDEDPDGLNDAVNTAFKFVEESHVFDGYTLGREDFLRHFLLREEEVKDGN